jgi:hypothetical protein
MILVSDLERHFVAAVVADGEGHIPLVSGGLEAVSLIVQGTAAFGTQTTLNDLGVHLLDFRCWSSDVIALGYHLGEGVHSASPSLVA